MVSDTGLIVVSIISLAGMVLMFMINNNNWFRRENFKIQKSNIMTENKIKIEKLRKEMGLQKGVKTDNMHETGGVMDLIKGLDANKLGGIIDVLKGDDGGVDDEPDDAVGRIMGLIDKVPPEVIEGILKGLNKDKEVEEGGMLYNG